MTAQRFSKCIWWLSGLNYVPSCLSFLRAFYFYVLHFFYVSLSWSFMFLTCPSFYVHYVPSFFYVPYVLIFYVPYVSIFLRPLRAFIFLRALCPDLLCSLRVHLFTCITCLHFFTCFQFLTCIMCVHFLNNKWNNLQQTASSWNKRERGRINQK